MAKNYFAENRKRLHVAFDSNNFFKPLTTDDLPLIIEEEKNRKYEDKLVIVRLKNIPVSDRIRPISYVLNTEIEQTFFSLPPGFKTAEKVIFIFTEKCVHAVVVEMKSAISPPLVKEIKDKIEHTIGRVALFLTHYLLDTEQYYGKDLKFSAIFFFNSDSLTNELNTKLIPDLQNSDLVNIFVGKYKSCFMTEPLGQRNKVDVFFKKNPNKSQEFDFDFSELFESSPDLANAVSDDRTLP